MLTVPQGQQAQTQAERLLARWRMRAEQTAHTRWTFFCGSVSPRPLAVQNCRICAEAHRRQACSGGAENSRTGTWEV